MINDFKAYFLRHGQPVYENPSPGNKAGGLTTLEEKSLGAIQKGGARDGDARAALRRAAARARGLALLESPGNDGVSSTAMVVSGATLLLFTTGRGTPLGFPVPTIKVSSNSEIAREEAALDRLQRRRAARRRDDDGAARGRAVRVRSSTWRSGTRLDQQRDERLSRDRDLEGRSHAVDERPCRRLSRELVASPLHGESARRRRSAAARSRAAGARRPVRHRRVSARIRRVLHRRGESRGRVRRFDRRGRVDRQRRATRCSTSRTGCTRSSIQGGAARRAGTSNRDRRVAEPRDVGARRSGTTCSRWRATRTSSS